MDHKKKFFLFKKSQNFCSVPWNYFKISSEGSVRTCAKGQTLLGNINDTSIQDILKSPTLHEIRRSLYHDQVPVNCQSCRQQDTDGYSYLKEMYNGWFQDADVDYSDFDAFRLSGVDLHWSSTCNIKCVTCWYGQSSAIARELSIPIVNVGRDKIQPIIDWLVSCQHSLKEIYFSGGEPSLIRHNVRLLERLEPRSDLLLRVNTNMTFGKNNPFMQQIARFPNVLVTMSADALGDRFEYIRQGARWNEFLDNANRMRDRGHGLRVNSVFFVASASTLIDTQHFFRQALDITDFTINQCDMERYSLQCRNLPVTVKKQVQSNIEHELASPHCDRNLRGQLMNCLLELASEPNSLDYRAFFDDIDQRRGTDWRQIFKELL